MDKARLKRVWLYYNTLPSLLEATTRFTGRDQLFHKLAELLSRYGGTFGVCLIHSHCELFEDEIMLEEDDASQPISLSNVSECYAERWLPSGEPFEFTTRPAKSPPDELIKDFWELTRDVGVLGLYYTSGADEHGVKLEWTEGRTNKTRMISAEDWDQHPVETGWNLGKGETVTMACILLCATATTAQGGHHLREFPEVQG